MFCYMVSANRTCKKGSHIARLYGILKKQREFHAENPDFPFVKKEEAPPVALEKNRILLKPSKQSGIHFTYGLANRI